MKPKILISLLWIGLGLGIGLMIGLSLDPIDSAIRKAQKINKGNLKNTKSFRSGNTKKLPLNERLKTDHEFSASYNKQLISKLNNKKQAIEILDETKEFIKLSTQEVFIENSLHKYLLSLGRIQLQNGMLFQSVTNLQRSYQINPSHPSTPNLLAKNYLRIYQILPDGSEKDQAGKNAIHFLQLQIQSNVEDIEAIYGLALIYSAQEKYEEALQLFSNILEKDPENIESLLGIGQIYYKRNNIDQAQKIYEQTESLILELKGRHSLWRRTVLSASYLDKKLSIVQHNLDIIHKQKNFRKSE